MSCPCGLPTVLIQFVITQESTTRTKWRKPWAPRVCEVIFLQSASDISRHSWVRKLSLWIKEMIHSFAHQLYQLFGFWELGFCNAKVLTYCNTMNTLQPNESFETSEASWRIKATSTASLMEDSNLRYKMFTSQKNSNSQVEGLVLRLVLGQVRAVRLVHVLVAALRFKIQ